MAPTEQQLKQAKAEQLAGLKKAPKARVQRYLKRTVEPKRIERLKSSLLFRGVSCNAVMVDVLKELKSIQAPNSKLLSKPNNVVPFDTNHNNTAAGPVGSIEFLCTKNDCALFGLASHNKKRPNNLIIGRTFNYQILDMVELGIVMFKSMKDYGGTIPKKRIGSKPLMLFVGDIWEHHPTYAKLQNLLIDYYRGDVVDSIVASGVDHIITFNAVIVPNSSNNNNNSIMIHQRTYFIKLKKNLNDPESKIPEPLLIPCGPDLDYTVRRTQYADDTTAAAARRGITSTPKIKTTKSVKSNKKNQSTNLFGETIGRLHIAQQPLDGRQTGRKIKSLRRAEHAVQQAEQSLIEQDLENEA